MESHKTSNRIHPLVAIAAISVTIVSLAGAAAITGLLPISHGTTAPTAAVTAPAAVTAATVAPDAELTAKLAANAGAGNSPAPQAKKPAPAKQTQASRAPAASTQASAKYHAPVAQAPRVCHDCGRVEAIYAVQEPAQPSGVGVVAGAVLGGVLGNQVGGGNGKTIATVAGAVGGGYAGNEIEKRSRATTTYQVKVRMEDGSTRTFSQASAEAWRVGDRVKVINGTLAARA